MSTLNYLGMLYVDFAAQGFYAYLILIISAIFTGILKRTTQRMPRSTYFLNTALVTFVAGASQFMWVSVFDAIVSGYVIVIAAADFAVWIGVGYFITMLAKARSNDAFGHSRFAPLGFIPIANFILLLKPSADRLQNQTANSAIVGVPAVFIGFIVLALGRAAGMEAEKAIERTLAELPQTTSAQRLGMSYFSFYTRRDGLAEGLGYLASLERPGQIDEITRLTAVTVDQSELTYLFNVTDDTVTHFNPDWVRSVLVQNCEHYAEVMENGGSVRFVYSSQGQGELENILANADICP